MRCGQAPNASEGREQSKVGIPRQLLVNEYVLKGRTDAEIARDLGFHRTYIVLERRRLGIPSRRLTGGRGELLAIRALETLGFQVSDMNQQSRLAPYDLLVNGAHRIDVKSAELKGAKDGYYRFTLSENSTRYCKTSATRIRLGNGRTRKLYRETCDFLILVGMDHGKADAFLIVPSGYVPDEQMTISIPSALSAVSKYHCFRDAWELLRR